MKTQLQNRENHSEVAARHEWRQQWCCNTASGSNAASDRVTMSWEVANQSAKVFEWKWSEWEWEWEVSKLLNFRVFSAKQWLKDLTTSIFFKKKIDVNEVNSTSIFQTAVEFSLHSSVTSIFGKINIIKVC